MYIKEMFESEPNKTDLQKELGYDLKDDIMCFMHNDPAFYRKEYFPTIHRFKGLTEQGRKINPKAFAPLVKKAYEAYKDKFKVQGLKETLEEDMFENLCAEIHRTETKNINDGHYDEK